MSGTLEVPNVDLDRDIGGYAKAKKRLPAEILDVLALKENMAEAAEITRLEEPSARGMMCGGPAGSARTRFPRAVPPAAGAPTPGAAGPELKRKWAGESEENLRQSSPRPRQSAPAIIVFDELDSFAAARGTYEGSG